MTRTQNTGQRNSFLDIIKFVFAVLIVLFHFGRGFVPGGRVAVEGFFMISGYFMMKSIERKGSLTNLGRETVRFAAHKYGALAQYLIPSAVLGVAAACILRKRSAETTLRLFMLLFFEVFPLNALGYEGYYPIGISWYLSAMLYVLLILYPLCRKYGARFIMTAGLALSLGIYGFLSKEVGSLAVPGWMEGFPLPLRILRAAAGCLAGCVLYEAAEKLKGVQLTWLGKGLVLALEAAGYELLAYIIWKLPKSKYDYLAVFLLFGLLLAGISNVTGLAGRCSFPASRYLGTASTLLVLNHFHWNTLLTTFYGKNYGGEKGIWMYLEAVLLSGAVSWLLGCLGKRAVSRIRQKLVTEGMEKTAA